MRRFICRPSGVSVERDLSGVEQNLVDQIDAKIVPHSLDLDLTVGDFLFKNRDEFRIRSELVLCRQRRSISSRPTSSGP